VVWVYTEGFEVVVADEVETKTHHALGDIAVEADSFPMVVGEVFSEFTVDVVGGEERV
jgi:hypothetical protein